MVEADIRQTLRHIHHALRRYNLDHTLAGSSGDVGRAFSVSRLPRMAARRSRSLRLAVPSDAECRDLYNESAQKIAPHRDDLRIEGHFKI